ncbi:MAG: hypothetical protein MHMPM18_000881 [Marteilia pararefringens]
MMFSECLSLSDTTWNKQIQSKPGYPPSQLSATIHAETSWNRVTKTIVHNCWKHTKLITGKTEPVELNDAVGIQEQVSKFHEVLNVPHNEKITLSGYLRMDNVATELILTDIDNLINDGTQESDE